MSSKIKKLKKLNRYKKQTMTNVTLALTIRFLVLVLLQVLLFNHINFLGNINPYPYILLILLYPINNNRTFFIFIAFLLGFCVDIFSDTGGIHAAASVTIAYARPLIIKFAFGTIYDSQTLKFEQTEVGNRLIYFFGLALIHHFVLFSLEVFNFAKIILILQKTLFSSIFTVFMCLVFTVLFSRKSK